MTVVNPPLGHNSKSIGLSWTASSVWRSLNPLKVMAGQLTIQSVLQLQNLRDQTRLLLLLVGTQVRVKTCTHMDTAGRSESAGQKAKFRVLLR